MVGRVRCRESREAALDGARGASPGPGDHEHQSPERALQDMSDPTINQRRAFLRNSALLAGGTALVGSGRVLAQTRPTTGPVTAGAQEPDLATAEPGQPGRDYTPVITPNGAALPWKLVDGAKVYHLI